MGSTSESSVACAAFLRRIHNSQPIYSLRTPHDTLLSYLSDDFSYSLYFLFRFDYHTFLRAETL